ncbi:hypothetical protein FSP39_005767 [Pinctada imbricata]|uniref:Uncharacterized protein n=1 Tax=Pinctada imbricata TaxID=66713 RepID=A0AA89BT40_PINIB|nr:hypothetical protein FSP39_005767 [Pinctada imbricata]
MSDTLDKKLVVYDVLENKSYAFKHQSMDAKPEHKNITISGKSTIAPLGINGIAMSSDFEYVYYTAVSDVNLYRIPTSVLRDSNSDDAEFARHYQVVGDKGVQSDGLYSGKDHNLYYSTLGKNGVMKWDISADESKSSDGDSKIQMKTVSDLGMDPQMEWIDSIGMDDDGFLWFTSNNLHEFFGNNTVPGSYNFYVWKSYVGDRSYLYKPEKQKLSMKTCDDSNSKGELMAEIAYNWTTVDLLWPNCSMKREMVSDGSFIPENNIIDGVRVYKDRIFVTIPKLKPGVPVTLAELVKGDARSPSIQPFPSWSWHNSQNCSALQLVQAIEIDPNTGHMWILDTTNAPRASSMKINPCPPKVVVYDIQNDQVLRNREFPSTLYSGQYFFGDMVLDIANSSNKFAYITDSSGWRLIVYDYENDYFYTFANPSMNADNNHQNISISGDVISVKDQGINGIAISPNFSHVYFSIMSGTKLFQIPTSILRNSNSGSPEFFNNLRIVGDTNSHTDVIYFAKSKLYYTALERNAINVWDIGADADRSKSYSNVTMTTNMTLVQNCQIGWVSSLSIDENKIMWFLSRETRPFYGNDTSLGTYNMRLWKVKVSERGYLDMTKDYNAILGAANLSSSFALSLFALLVFLYTINL